MIQTSLILTFLLFGIYGWLCSVQCGLGLLRLLPSSTFTRHGLRLLRPLWFVTNIFLVLGLVAFGVLFSNGLTATLHPAGPVLLFSAGAIAVRVVFLVYFLIGNVRAGLRWQNFLFNAVTALVPLSFGAAGIILLTGHDFWQSSTGWTMMITLLVWLMAVALSFVYFVVGQTPHDRLHQVSRWLNVGLGIISVSVLPLLIARHDGHLLSAPYTYLIILLSLTAVWQIGLWLSARERYMWWYLSLVGIFTPLLLALANKPYLLYPTMTVSKSYGSGGAIVLAIILPVVVIGTGFFVRSLLVQPEVVTPKPKKKLR